MSPDKKMIKAFEVSELLGVAPSTLRTWRKKKVNLDFYRVGSHRVLYRLDEVMDYLASCRIKKVESTLPGGPQC